MAKKMLSWPLASRDQLQTRRCAEERQLNDRAEETEKDDLTFVVRILWKPLLIRFCPLKILGDSFCTVNNQNLQEFKRIYKGQKSITKGFLEINIACFARKDETFWVIFKHCEWRERKSFFMRSISIWQQSSCNLADRKEDWNQTQDGVCIIHVKAKSKLL